MNLLPKGNMFTTKVIVLLVTIGVAFAGNYGNNFNYGNNYPYTGSYAGLNNGFNNIGYSTNINGYHGYGKGVYNQVVLPHPYPYPVPIPAQTGRRIITVGNNNGLLGNMFGIGGNGIFSK